MGLMKAFLMGDPVAHSRSPFFYHSLAQKFRCDFQYELHSVSREHLDSFLIARRKDRLIGFNITSPHKETVIRHLDRLSEEACLLKAVNTVVIQEGVWTGYNTDYLGVLRALRDVPLEGQRALLLGAGGVSKAVAYALGLRGVARVGIGNRTQAHAQALADQMQKIFPQICFEVVKKSEEACVLVVQTTARFQEHLLGLEFLKTLPPSALGTWALDLVYDPEETFFLKFASQQGWQGIGGLSILKEVTEASWNLWWGHSKKPIFLVGFSGVGKTTVGRLLAQKLGRSFLDTDAWVVDQAQMSVTRIFSEKGETWFRKKESEILKKALEGSQVVALGAGALMDPENARLIFEKSWTVCLEASWQALWNRWDILVQDRPLFQAWETFSDVRKKQELERLFELRKCSYQKSFLHYCVDDQTPESVSAFLQKKLWKLV